MLGNKWRKCLLSFKVIPKSSMVVYCSRDCKRNHLHHLSIECYTKYFRKAPESQMFSFVRSDWSGYGRTQSTTCNKIIILSQ